MKPTYAGVGARDTPSEIITIMRAMARVLAKDKFVCNTGAALGADQAFAEGALCGGGEVELLLPWKGYEKHWIDNLVGSYSTRILGDQNMDRLAYLSVSELHPSSEYLTAGVKRLHARNFLILQNVKFVICWTKGGSEIGGTGQTIRIAETQGIKLYNLGNPNVLKNMVTKLQKLGQL